MIAEAVHRDERTTAVENASYRHAYLVLSYGLLAATAYRGFLRHESAWDLLALVLLGGAVATLHQGSHRILSRRWAALSAGAAGLAALLAAVLALMTR